jgi:hypothetical protein
MRFAAFALAVALSACTFTSEHPLFSAHEAAFPIADGAHFLWRDPESDDAPKEVVYRREGPFYEIAPTEGDEKPMLALFVALRGGPRDDYLVQVSMDKNEEERVYAYMVREDDHWLIFSSPGVLDQNAAGQDVRARYCTTLSYGECRLETRNAALAVFRGYFAHHVASDAEARHGVVVQAPVGAAGDEPAQ